MNNLWIEVRTSDDMSWWATTGLCHADVPAELTNLVAKAAKTDPKQGVAIVIRAAP